MSYINFNPNPDRKLVGDCVIRAISKAMNQSWDDTYIGLMLQGYSMHDMPPQMMFGDDIYLSTDLGDILFLIHAQIVILLGNFVLIILN